MKRTLSVVQVLILAALGAAHPLMAHADDAVIPVSALLHQDLKEVRAAFGGELQPGDNGLVSTFETATVRIEAPDRRELVQKAGFDCQAFVWPDDYDYAHPHIDYAFVFSNGELRTLAKLIKATPFKRGYRLGPGPNLRPGERLPLEAGVDAYVDELVATPPPVGQDVKVHCAPAVGMARSPSVAKDEKLFASIRVGMDIDARAFARAHGDVASLFAADGGRYYVMSIKQRRPFGAKLKFGDGYKFLGVRDNRVEWLATGAFAGGVGAGICASGSNGEAQREHCSSDGVFYP